MRVPHSRATQPPQAPEQVPRLRLSVTQRVGLPLMALVPLLALGGVFGECREGRATTHGPLVVQAQVPTRFRYRERMTLDLSVTNGGGATLDDVQVRLDSAYLARFSNVSVAPSPGSDGAVRLGRLAAGESARLAVTLEGERAGAHHGTVVTTDAAGDTARLAVASTVFP